jgi:hypothetical protein
MFEPDDDRPLTSAEILRTEAGRSAGSARRYVARRDLFNHDGDPLPRARHHILWILHNCVAHPLLAFGATQPAVEFHELTSQWLNAKPPAQGAVRPNRPLPTTTRVLQTRIPEVTKPFAWVLHNVVAHTAIGLAPCKATFAFHDWSAKKMNVPGWV